MLSTPQTHRGELVSRQYSHLTERKASNQLGTNSFFHLPQTSHQTNLQFHLGFPNFPSISSDSIPSMASVHTSLPAFSGLRRCSGASSPPPPSLSLPTSRPNGRRKSSRQNLHQIVKQGRICRAMVQQAVQGAPATYAKEMERLSAKESLLLALKDAGGFEAVVTGKVTEVQRVDVMERITGLERLNPTTRPTTSPYLEGKWNFEWFGSGSPAFAAAQIILERLPTTLANLLKMDVLLKDGSAKATANLRLLNSVESKLIISSKLTIEGPQRMKEEYVEGILESPSIVQEAVPDQLKGALGQATGAVQQLPAPIKDVVSSGIRIPLSGTFQRMFMISYLDEEIFIIRDAFGVPEVLTRVEEVPSDGAPVTEYES